MNYEITKWRIASFISKVINKLSKYKKSNINRYINDINKSISNKESLKKQGLNFISEESLKKHIDVHDKTLFILGSGSTINDLNDKQWSIIKKNVSFGFNYFLLHDFVPDVYFYETPKDKNLVKLFRDCWVQKKEYKKIPLIIQGTHYIGNEFDLSFHDNVYFQVPYRIKSPDLKFVDFILKHEYLRPKSQTINLIHHAASVSYLIDLGRYLGFKNIVLLGIDLQGPYFYDSYSDEYANKMKDIYSGKLDSKIHLTADKSQTNKYNELTIVQYLQLYRKNILDKKGIKLYAGSNKSKLSDILEVYTFE